jgi:sugar transferase (PEP-CTERM system associated)
MIKIFYRCFQGPTFFKSAFDLVVLVATLAVAVEYQGMSQASAEYVVATTVTALILGILLISVNLGFYQPVSRKTVGQTRVRAMLSMVLALPAGYGAFHLSSFKFDAGDIFMLTLIALLALTLAHRIHVIHSSPAGMKRHRVLILGAGTRAKSVAKILSKSDITVDMVGYYSNLSEVPTDLSDKGILSPGKSLKDVVVEHRIDEILVAPTDRRGGSMPMRELLDCKLQGVHVVDIATHFEQSLGQIRLDSVSAGWLIFGDGFRQGLMRTISKRIFDILCATILIVLSLPVMLVTAALILIESGAPILYRQERVGLNGRLFNVVKFRSMRTDAEKDGKPRWACAADDRVTRVGRFIRKFRIDELPQLFSVLGNSMSLVGPRPERPYFVDKLTHEIPYFAVRQSVKPGVTGWAQVRYHYGASVKDAEEKLQYDLYYVKNHSLLLDLIVLIETVSVVVMRKGSM